MDTSPPLCKTEQPRQVHTIADRFAMANTYIIDAHPLIVVDPRSDMHVHLLCEYVESILKRSLTEIGMIVLTNLHADQSDGLAAMQHVVHAPVAAAAALLHLVQSQRDTLHAYGWSRPGHTILPPSFERQMSFVSDWLEDSMRISSWQVIAYPSHSPDSLCLYNSATAEFISGDTVIAIQKHTPVLRAGSDRRQLETMLRFLRTLHVHYVYPSCGRPMLALHPLSNMGVEW
jgi:glyoxylase-like metal-dependent hydrolase (beta-lactamase superfamily II)